MQITLKSPLERDWTPAKFIEQIIEAVGDSMVQGRGYKYRLVLGTAWKKFCDKMYFMHAENPLEGYSLLQRVQVCSAIKETVYEDGGYRLCKLEAM